MDYLDAIQPIADSVGMGWYFDQIRKECNEKREEYRAERATFGCMKNILEENMPKDGEVLLVHAKTGTERKAFHLWAKSKNLDHCAIKTDHFEPAYLYRCKVCQRTYYDEEMCFSADWSMIDPGICFGSIIKCRFCDSSVDTEYMGDPEEDIKALGSGFNAVIIGKVLPEFPKGKVRKHKKISAEENGLLDKIGERKIKILPLSSF